MADKMSLRSMRTVVSKSENNQRHYEDEVSQITTTRDWRNNVATDEANKERAGHDESGTPEAFNTVVVVLIERVAFFITRKGTWANKKDEPYTYWLEILLHSGAQN